MVQQCGNYLRGFLIIEIQGDSPERFVNMCAHHGIKVWDLKEFEKIYNFKVFLNDFYSLKKFAYKLGIKVKIRKRCGIPFTLSKIRKRPIFIPGMVISISLIYLYTLMVWNITVEGNSAYSENEIISFLNQNNLYVSMWKNSINTGDIVSLIRSDFPDIIWVTAHVEGCLLTINVKENQQINISDYIINDELQSNIETLQGTEASNVLATGYDIVAQQDGIIASIITRNGVPLVHEGDLVEKGQILVSGALEITTDYEEIIDYCYIDSDADIYIEEIVQYNDLISLQTEDREYSKKSCYNFSIGIGEWYMATKFNLCKDYLVEMKTTEYELHPPKQEKYNCVFGIQKTQKYDVSLRTLSDDEIRDTLTLKFREFINEMSEKGVEIIENNVNIVIDDKFAVAEGELKLYIHNTLKQATEYKEILEISEE